MGNLAIRAMSGDVGVHGEDEQKNFEKGWKWVKVGEHPKMPCGRSIKTYARGNNVPSITKYGSPVRLDAQIVALRAHCAKGAPLDAQQKRWRVGGSQSWANKATKSCVWRER